METESHTIAKEIGVANKQTIRWNDFVLRFLAFVVTLVAAIVLGVSKQNELVPVQLVPTLPPINVPASAKWSHMSAFVYFVIVNAIACAYAVISLVLSLANKGKTKGLSLTIILFDLIMMALLYSSVGAAAAVGLIGYKGNTHVRWNKVCDVFGKFCGQVVAAIAISLVGSILFLLLVLLATVNLHKNECVEESAFLASLCDEEWDPDELLASIDDEMIDFRIESAENDTNSTKGAEKQVNPKRRKRKKQLNSNKARDERRFEVVRLRREAEDLQLTLKKLKAIRSEQGIETGDASTQGGEEGEIPAVWQEICTRQLNRRLKAENENVKLKKQLEEEKRVVKSIEKMLFKRMALREMDREARKHTRRTNVPVEYIKRVAAFIFDELSASVEISYREVEGIVAGNGPVPKNVVTHQPLLRGGMKGMYRRLFDKRHVPFTLQETGDAWWRYWYTYRGRSIVGATSNVVTESYGLEMTDLKTNASATSYGQQILRRHVEENRIVFVWNAYIEPFVFKNQPVSGIYLLEQSHVLIKPEVTEEGDECSTSMSTCYVITPHFLDPKLKDDPETTALINFLVSALSANIRNRNEAVENLLLDEALQKHHNS